MSGAAKLQPQVSRNHSVDVEIPRQEQVANNITFFSLCSSRLVEN